MPVYVKKKKHKVSNITTWDANQWTYVGTINAGSVMDVTLNVPISFNALAFDDYNNNAWWDSAVGNGPTYGYIYGAGVVGVVSVTGGWGGNVTRDMVSPAVTVLRNTPAATVVQYWDGYRKGRTFMIKFGTTYTSRNINMRYPEYSGGDNNGSCSIKVYAKLI